MMGVMALPPHNLDDLPSFDWSVPRPHPSFMQYDFNVQPVSYWLLAQVQARRYGYPPPVFPRSPPPEPPPVRFVFPGDEEFRPEARRLAKVGLDYYNTKNGTGYEFVDDLASRGILDDDQWYHCNFTAKLPSSDVVIMFFAELKLVATGPRSRDMVATACHTLEEGKPTQNCNYCSHVIHPLEGEFQIGL